MSERCQGGSPSAPFTGECYGRGKREKPLPRVPPIPIYLRRSLSWVGFTKSSHLTYNRHLPCVVQYRGVFLFRPIHPQHQLEFAGRSWQPVGFLPGTRTILLDVQVSRTIWVWYEVLTSAEGVTIYWVCDEEEILVVHRQRPEAVHWW